MEAVEEKALTPQSINLIVSRVAPWRAWSPKHFPRRDCALDV
jgi:hypothetical protein